MDTQTIAWVVGEPQRLSEKARASVIEARRGVGMAISDKTLWELAMLVTRRRIEITISLSSYLREIEKVCTVLPIDSAIAGRSMNFSEKFPRDLADKDYCCDGDCARTETGYVG